MALSTKARKIVDAVAGGGFSPDFIEKEVKRLAAQRKPPSPGPGEKLTLDKHGRWVIEKISLERFRKGGLSPATIAFVKSLTAKSPATKLLEESRKDVMNSREQRMVLDAVQPEMVKGMRARRHVMNFSKRANMPEITAEEMQGAAPLVPTKPKPTTGLSTEPEFEQEITTEVLDPAEAARLFMDRRREMRREGMPGMRPTLRTDAYGAKD